ncbi:MAG: hypothetical protein B7C24_03005 [Bacteroidetes bacterium 4572_77]|nr:MAG: hypothetical protein B7C24_03005 [Bacteroidetes bacterium 4572_77]
MKSLYIIVFSMLLAFSALAQKQQLFPFEGNEQVLQKNQNLRCGRIIDQNRRASRVWDKDIKQRLDSLLSYEENMETKETFLDSKEYYTYDVQGRCIKEVDCSTDDWGEELIPRSQMIYEFDAQGYASTYLYNQWNVADQEWRPYYRVDYSYENGLLDSAYSANWNNESLSWEYDFRFIYTYDDKAKILLAKTQIRSESNEWVDSYKVDYLYDAQNRMMNTLSYAWIAETQLWQESFKQEWTYTTLGKVATDIHYIWEVAKGQWMPSYKTEYAYHIDGAIDEMFYSYYEMDNWFFSEKYTYVYEEDIFMGTIAAEFVEGEWFDCEKTDIAYNTDYPSSEMLLPYDYWEGAPVDYMITQIASFQMEMDWVLMEDSYFYYSLVNVDAVEELSSESLKIYPNPSHGIVHINLAKLHKDAQLLVYNSLGQLVMQNDISKEDSNLKIIDFSSFESGIYLFQLKIQGQEVTQEKLIIQ